MYSFINDAVVKALLEGSSNMIIVATVKEEILKSIFKHYGISDNQNRIKALNELRTRFGIECYAEQCLNSYPVVYEFTYENVTAQLRDVRENTLSLCIMKDGEICVNQSILKELPNDMYKIVDAGSGVASDGTMFLSICVVKRNKPATGIQLAYILRKDGKILREYVGKWKYVGDCRDYTYSKSKEQFLIVEGTNGFQCNLLCSKEYLGNVELTLSRSAENMLWIDVYVDGKWCGNLNVPRCKNLYNGYTLQDGGSGRDNEGVYYISIFLENEEEVLESDAYPGIYAIPFTIDINENLHVHYRGVWGSYSETPFEYNISRQQFNRMI